MKKLLYLLTFAILGAFNVAAQNGFTTITNLTPVPVSTNTGEKPQAKVWKYAGKHWAVLPNSSGTHLWRLDGTTWTSVLRLSTRTSSKADCKMVGSSAHILLFQGASSQLVSVEYSELTGSYQLWSKRSSTVGLQFASGVETATLDIDGEGRMWIAYDGTTEIYVQWSDSPYHTWNQPVTLATGVDLDDICAVIAMQGKVGVLWSDQTTQRFGFRTHEDGAPPTLWSEDEVPASQSAINIGGGMADDHMNLALASDGTLFCGVKTEYNKSGYPDIALLVRQPTGNWDNLYEVAPRGTRPIVVLNEDSNKLRVVYTSQNGGGNILYRESSVSNISFGMAMTLISGNYNNSTSTKDNFTSEIVILASDNTHAVGVLATDEPSLPPINVPVLESPENLYTNVSTEPTLSWHPFEGAESYRVQLSETSDFLSLEVDQSNITATSFSVTGLKNETTYYWRVMATNTDGDSNWSAIWSFTTISDVPYAPKVSHWKMDEGSGTTLFDASGYGNHATTVGDPVWITGLHGYAMRFNGNNQFATAPDNASLDISEAVSILTWIRPEKAATQYLIKKAEHNGIDGYELALASGGKIFFRFNQTSSGDTYRLNSQDSYPTDGSTWVHVAVTYDGSVMRMYLNGIQNSSKTISSPVPISMNELELTIGAESGGFRGFQGAMDDIYIFNRALSAVEINDLMIGETSLPPINVPVLESPENLYTNVSTEPTLSWHPFEGAESYRVQLSETSDFLSLEVDQSNITATSFSVTGLKNETTYYWRVMATNADGDSNWSAVWSFTTSSEVAYAPKVSHWKMDEGSGTTLFDASGYGNHATTFGDPVWITGLHGYAMRFNGNNQFAAAPDNASLDISEAVSILTWIRPEKTATQYLIKKAEHNGIDGYELALASGGKIFFRFNQPSSGDTYRLNSQDSYPTDGSTWVHVAVTYDGSVMRMYLNGILNSSKTIASPVPISMNELELTIGAESGGFRGFQGAMDDIYIFDRALSEVEINDLMTAPSFPTDPVAPLLIAPEDLSTGVSTDPYLSWNSAADADSYRVQVSTDAAFSSTVFDQGGITEPSVNVTGLENGTDYFWRVRAASQDGESDWSDTWMFTTAMAEPTLPETPLLNSPEDLSTDIPTDAQLSWNNAEGAGSYRVQVATEAAFSSTVFDQGGITEPSVNVMGLENGTDYFWRVRAASQDGESDWSDTWMFTTAMAEPTLPETPLLNSPEDLSTDIPTDAQLSWNPAQGADSYRVQVSTDAAFSSTVFDQGGITEPSANVTGLENGTNYFWRVRAASQDGESNWSDTWMFTTAMAEPTLPETPLLNSPEDLSTDIPTDAQLSWNNAEGAGSYRVQVATEAAFSSTVFDQGGITEPSVNVTGLENGTNYFWRVRAVNDAGDSEWSATWMFTTITAPQKGLLVAHWKMDEGSGTTLWDASGFGNNATTIGNPTWLEGVHWLAVRFNGLNQYATVPSSSSLGLAGPITIAAWIRPEKKGLQYLVSKAAPNTTDGIELYLANNSKVFFRLNQATSKESFRLNSQSNYPTDGSTWMHVAVTYDGAEMNMYIDGVLNSSKTFSSGPPIGINQLPLTIGAEDGGSNGLQGAIDDMRIYNTALSPSAIQELIMLTAAARLVSTENPKPGEGKGPQSRIQLELAVYPNPFSTRTNIVFSLPETEGYLLDLYDNKGTKITNLMHGIAEAGEQINFELDGSGMSQGLYLIRLQTTSGQFKTTRLLLIR